MVAPVTFEEYLEAKRAVDDRAINRRVWDAFVDSFGSVGSQEPPHHSRRILEVGAGSGTMVDRLSEWGVKGPLEYTGIEPNASLAARARLRLTPRDWSVRFLDTDLAGATGLFDVVLAHAVLDILQPAESLRRIVELLHPQGLLYATITFDGLTVFEPIIDPELDRQVIDAYHLAMGSRSITNQGDGGPQAGRRIVSELPSFGLDLLAAGSSDWVIAPTSRGYPLGDVTVARWLLQTIHRAVNDTIEDPRLIQERKRLHISMDSDALEKWVDQRSNQLEERRLVVIVHQIDFCSRKLS